MTPPSRPDPNPYPVQQREDDPSDDVTTFRVPAEPEAFAARGRGVLDAGPVPRGRSTPVGDRRERWREAAEEISALLDEIVPRVTTFRYGYEFEGDRTRDEEVRA